MTFKDVVQLVSPKLWVLPAGISPPNPIVLLDSKKMSLLIAELKDHYDCIIFDTPSLLGTADTSVVGKLSDGVLLVVRLGTISTNEARLAKESLSQSDQNILGMVINDVQLEQKTGSYFYSEKYRDTDQTNNVIGKASRVNNKR